MARDELLIAINISLPSGNTTQHWQKVGTRRAQAISKVMAAATMTVADGRVVACKLAMGAVADRPIRLPDVENLIVGQTPNEDLARQTRQLVEETIQRVRFAFRRFAANGALDFDERSME